MPKDTESTLVSLRARVKEQGDLVSELKANEAPEFDIKNEITELKTRKKALKEKELELRYLSIKVIQQFRNVSFLYGQ